MTSSELNLLIEIAGKLTEAAQNSEQQLKDMRRKYINNNEDIDEDFIAKAYSPVTRELARWLKASMIVLS